MSAGLGVGAEAASAEPQPPMSAADTAQYLAGVYTAIQPSPAELAGIFGELPNEVTIRLTQGSLELSNRLAVNSKDSAATYRAISSVCYAGDPMSSCRVDLELVKMGTQVHFLGVHPTLVVERSHNGVDGRSFRVRIQPDYSLAGFRRVPAIIVERQ